MKHQTFLLLFVLLGIPAYAQNSTTPPPDSAAGQPETATSGVPAMPDKAQSATTNSAAKTPQPATRFTPTEKIRADQAVAFPVDI